MKSFARGFAARSNPRKLALKILPFISNTDPIILLLETVFGLEDVLDPSPAPPCVLMFAIELTSQGGGSSGGEAGFLLIILSSSSLPLCFPLSLLLSLP